MTIILISSLLFVSLGSAILFYLIFSRYLLPKPVILEQLEFYRHAWESYYGRSFRLGEAGMSARFIDAILATIGRLSQFAGVSAILIEELEKSGLAINIRQFIFYHSLFAIFMGLFGYFIWGFMGIIVFVILGAFLPIAYLNILKNKRKNTLSKQLPELLAMVSGLLKVGHGFQQALDASVKEMKPPISYEFKKVLIENRLGISFEQALDNLSKRVKISDFDWLVLSIKIQRETGGNLAEILDMLAETMRQREELAGQIKALTAEGRLSAFILIGLPFLIAGALFLINPGYIGLMFSTSAGIMMLIVAGVLMVVGIFWLKKVVEIKV
ncbi:MAG TPA: hypothetical protein ENH19_03255 [Actinobacteria bacterium]|nr:hypothetical protein [Actinomycetes bacterium]HEX21654.1 hypothetical protein [Actinomycetota bacterium]